MSMQKALDEANAKQSRIEQEITRLDERIKIGKAEQQPVAALEAILDDKIAELRRQISEVSDIREAMGLSRYDR
jgi:chromosome segregation ATPase